MNRRATIAALLGGLAISLTGMLPAQTAAQDPAPIRSLSADAGYVFRFGAASQRDGYYRIEYQGKPVKESGTPFKEASSLDLLAPAPLKVGGDVPALSFRYESAKAFAGGGLLEALGTKELPLAGLSALGMRGTAQLGSDVDLKHIQASVGLETPPARIPGFANNGFSNWIVIGADVERREVTDSTAGDASLALGTFRSFLGKAIGWRKSADVVQTTAKIVHDVMTLAPTKAAALALKPKLDSIPANRRTVLQQTVLDLIGEVRTDAEWTDGVQALATGQADAITDQPTAAVYVEWSGWVDLASEPATGRFHSLFTASLNYWFVPARDDVFLRLHYERGYERASPTVERNDLIISIAVRM